MTDLTSTARSSCFGGTVEFFQYSSQVCNGPMSFGIYLPPQAQLRSVPVLYFLSGLTCTPENFLTKAGAQQFAARQGVALVVPDTSPRQRGIAGEDDSYDLGSGAGFYVNATEEPWHPYYQMYDYVTRELPELVANNFPIDDRRRGICGHSMGGHGALVCGLRNPELYRSISAFAPIVNPSACPWGQKALGNYLGDRGWADYDATTLVAERQVNFPILIDQGSADQFLADQLLPEKFVAACEKSGQKLNFRMQEGYDHSYYFISTFFADHLLYHAELLF
jgi:S-formylglutathione hydrolase